MSAFVFLALAWGLTAFELNRRALVRAEAVAEEDRIEMARGRAERERGIENAAGMYQMRKRHPRPSSPGGLRPAG